MADASEFICGIYIGIPPPHMDINLFDCGIYAQYGGHICFVTNVATANEVAVSVAFLQKCLVSMSIWYISFGSCFLYGSHICSVIYCKCVKSTLCCMVDASEVMCHECTESHICPSVSSIDGMYIQFGTHVFDMYLAIACEAKCCILAYMHKT